MKQEVVGGAFTIQPNVPVHRRFTLTSSTVTLSRGSCS
jgi:hypothetical protein